MKPDHLIITTSFTTQQGHNLYFFQESLKVQTEKLLQGHISGENESLSMAKSSLLSNYVDNEISRERHVTVHAFIC